MAAYGQDMGGNQIFVSIRRGKEYPPQVVDIRYVYECGFMLCWRMRRSCVSMYVWVKSVCVLWWKEEPALEWREE